MKKAKKWYDYLWIWSILYFSLGFFNILFAWLGLIVMALYKPRSWCTFCPMGCMTQGICKVKYRKAAVFVTKSHTNKDFSV